MEQLFGQGSHRLPNEKVAGALPHKRTYFVDGGWIMSKSDGCKQNSVLGGSGWQAGAAKEEIPAKRHQPPFHLYVNAQPRPPFSVALALELFVISFLPIQLIEKPHLSIPLIVCHAILTLVLLLSVTLLS